MESYCHPGENRDLQDKPSKDPGLRRDDNLLLCVQSGEMLDKDRMIRFVIGPGNTLYPDFHEDLPGPVFWCNLYRETVEKAIEEKAFGPDVVIPADIMDQIEKGIRNQAISMISMARKAGQLATRAEKTEQLSSPPLLTITDAQMPMRK